ncbi:histidinol phosphate aminotransferase [Acetobacter estunensis NRIC 0472]|uniref:Histidinol-phosphate aminotransferase n=1 Tax=Acetobacter estunensis TaxID=104097 RepID=A0A967EDZ3_9PROT|nr:histidinol-phosphate transaminase [Acetobacter estunensis]NHO54816.1 histidinol-phosphate transaminase [Acetobacter estunensis]GBQ27437.1 histidinol phosphate aminotransferase [Acetobacter estunensis NRIC 0472]
MSRFWSPLVHRLTPYVPGEQPKIHNIIKLNTNESPYGPSPKALEAMRAASDDSLRLYPDPESLALREAIARREGLTPAHVFAGNGSDEVLAHAFQAFFNHGDPVLFPDITYSFYPVYCGLYGLPFETVALDAGMNLPLSGFDRPNSGIVVANPNAPTGIALSRADIEKLVMAHPDRVVLIDEAYVDFGAETAVPLVKKYPNLLVVQTFSKSRALAGLRVGFALGDPALIEGLNRVKDSFNSYPLDRLAQAGALAAYEDEDWLRQSVNKVIATRTTLATSLAELGFEVLRSSANFVYARHPDRDAATLAATLRERAIIVRHLKGPRTSPWLRVTIGTDAQCSALTEALREILRLNA